MSRLTVWITLPDGTCRTVGELAFGTYQANGTCPTAFRYTPEWLSTKGAFALDPDPQSLALESREYQASNLGPPLQVIDDALPDDWGKRLIVAELNLPMSRQIPFEYLRAIGGDSLGALGFSEGVKLPPPKTNESIDLDDLTQAALDFDAGLPVEQSRLRRLYAAGRTPGGARPKARVVDDGCHWIAKFASPARDNAHDVVGLEATCLTLATNAGLTVPRHRLLGLGMRRAVLVERFDITAANGRRHVISLRSLCGERGGRYAITYDEPAACVRKYSDDPGDVARFFRQMVFNAAIGNTDDHLKNFALMRDESGWRLTPAFDLVPDIGRNLEHTLAIGHSRHTPSYQDLVTVGKRWLGSESTARQIVDEVVFAVTQFEAVASALAVAPTSVAFFSKDIATRLARIR